MDMDEIICNCMGITRGEIINAIKSKGLTTVEQVSEETQASTGCGGCAEEVEKIIKETNG
jgi:NAD(P)H-nitrite reductase large subunit